jgi:hypothetical protein
MPACCLLLGRRRTAAQPREVFSRGPAGVPVRACYSGFLGSSGRRTRPHDHISGCFAHLWAAPAPTHGGFAPPRHFFILPC